MSKIDLDKAIDHKGRNRLTSFKWQELREKVLKKDKGLCRICKKPGNEVDHIVPVALGGTDEENNLRTLCDECHKKKTKEDVEKVRRVRRFKTYSRRIGGFD